MIIAAVFVILIAMMANNNDDSPLLWGLLAFAGCFAGGLLPIPFGTVIGGVVVAAVYGVMAMR